MIKIKFKAEYFKAKIIPDKMTSLGLFINNYVDF